MKLNRLLVGALFNKKEPQAVGDEHPQLDALQRLLGKLQLWTRVERPTETVSLGAAYIVKTRANSSILS